MSERRGQEDQEPTDRQLLNLLEASPFLGLSRNRLYDRIARKQLPEHIVVRLGSRIYLKRAPLLKWLGVLGVREDKP
jgi:predicted DNA-binding transcriptional regulator AlpA